MFKTCTCLWRAKGFAILIGISYFNFNSNEDVILEGENLQDEPNTTGLAIRGKYIEAEEKEKELY